MRDRGLGAAAAALLVLASMAGCIGTDTPEQLEENRTPEAENLGIPQVLGMDGCSEQLGIFPVVSPPGEELAELPEGFESDGLLYIFATTCTSKAAEGGHVSQLNGGLFVTPPSELAREDAVGHALPLGGFVSDANVTAIFQAWNLGDLAQGEVTVELLGEAGPARLGHALGTDGDLTVHMYSEAAVPIEGEPGVVRFFGTDDGEVTNAVDMTWTAASALQGEATVIFEGEPSLPFPPPAQPGIVQHWWGEDYAFEFTYVPLEELPNR